MSSTSFFFHLQKQNKSFFFGEVIASITYLGSWGFVTLITVFIFWQDDCSFVLGDFGANNLGPLPFKAHLM